jgi:hypothetical protein
MSFSNG